MYVISFLSNNTNSTIMNLARVSYLTVLLLMGCKINACELVMGYRLNERLPLIEAYPSNRGLYFELYAGAAQKIGCTLRVVREPKKRLLRKLQTGEIDFYPGFTFSQERANYAYYFENGLTHRYGMISRNDEADVYQISELKNRVMLVAQGGPTHQAERYGVIIRYVENLSLAKAAKIIEKRQADFYVYNAPSIDYFLKYHPTKTLKKHPCCGDTLPMYLGFSKQSTHYQSKANLLFKPGEAISPTNYPESLEEQSVAYKLRNAIATMLEEGEITALYKRYYGSN